jgi:hypothetical protein
MFLNPFAMVVGGALISAPILIHLINRMRFKRIRWAAMEFLLKSQKRNRRRLIIEQIILLMLRCLLVLLAGLLMARFVGDALGITSTSGTTHVVLLDDSLSMLDKALQNQQPQPDAWEAAKKQVANLADTAMKAQSAQNLTLITMSKREVLFNERLNEESIGQLKKVLDDLKPTKMHVDPSVAIEAGKEKLTENKDTKRWLHLVSDFREQDWGRKPANEKLHQLLNEVAETGAQVTLIDSAAPSRADQRGQNVDYHNNFAITELKAEKRIAPAGVVVPFIIEVENFGNEAVNALFIEVYRDGEEDKMASRYYEPAPSPGTKQRYSFDMIFDAPPEGQTSAFHRVTARLKGLDTQSGLVEDNVRHAVIEIRKEVPTLIIDGNKSVGLQSGGDTRVIVDALESVKGTEAVKVVYNGMRERNVAEGVEELLRLDLEREYATIYLLNIENFKSKGKEKDKEDLPLQKLKQFVQNGGNVVFFMGDRIDPDYYNEILYEANHGLFPVPIETRSTTRISDKEIEARRASNAPKIFVLESDHDITRGIYGVQYKIPDLIIARHTPAKERFLWEKPEWTKSGDIKELITLAELKPLDDTTRTYVKKQFIDRIPVSDPNYKQYQALLKKHKQLIDQASLGQGDEMYKIAEAIDNMLNERGDKPNDKDNVSLQTFWALPDQQELKRDLLNFRKSALYGKPLVLTRKYGKGSVVAFMTTAGTGWDGQKAAKYNGWSGWSGGLDGGVASFTFPMIIADLQKYLTHGGDTGSRLVGETTTFALDPKEYKNEVTRLIQVDEGLGDPTRNQRAVPLGLIAEDVKIGKQENGKFVFTFENVAHSGVEVFQMQPLARPVKEERWLAFNVDPASESNLRRVPAEEVARNPNDAPPTRGKIRWIDLESAQKELREQKSDLSESPWFYILILLVLVIEQALAVHLSFHVKGGEGATPGPAAARASQPVRPGAPTPV